MSAVIPGEHPLRYFFANLTHDRFSNRLGWNDLPVSKYVADVLTDFAHIENLYKVRNHKGEPLKEVGEMLLEADIRLNAGSYEREREVYRHIGDFTLFMLGIFPEYLQRIKHRYLIHHPDFLLDYVKVGKQSYRNVSLFESADKKDSYLTYRKLAENFELCIVGLGYVKDQLDQTQPAQFDKFREIFLN